MKIFVGTDHNGFGLKEKLIPFLKDLGHEVIDKGAYVYDELDDFPDFIVPVAKEVSASPDKVRGIILGGSGQGEAMCANRFKGVRAVVYYGVGVCMVEECESIIEYSRGDNDSNVLSLGARFLNEEMMQSAVKEWLDSPFKTDPKYKRRIDKLDKI
jgi:ribose 5-phosphate isomerase B